MWDPTHTTITMPTKRKASSSSSNATTKRSTCATDIARAIEKASRDHVTLSKNVQKNIEVYQASSQHIQTVWEETLRNADQVIQDKERRLSDLGDQIEYQLRQGKIKVDQDLAQYGLTEAKKVLEKHDLVSLHKDELAQLQADLSSIQTEHENALQKAVQEIIAKEKAINSSIQAKTKSECALSLAETKAQLASKDVIIESLRERIKRCEADMEAQRELTRSVAQSASQSATNVYTSASK